ncbi:uncharacterized protein VDAG_00356 [Verticillium dahliae VdLs.17]|uniref:Uncharacterized protein n=2 Tax=Verticillium dahliae TaxID=27337 RepID=G2WS23_VERDV|nr:uncharacterized protein VDAG_00356 [Verticillium dahliae VdLs.17]EGY13674.1 hypothetical protein VDAG_00356 [Verticillium dahliae VdLs.17]KAF3350483.1 Cross-pathway control protein 1 [Verticillium dahliae VDG2]KAH6710133.1 hypothetical protein EV126DRAFT_406595 [Verticillium dahliae]PNH34093.1 hypothetical protein BJF96_g2501 [Verticillium dahliae]
MATGQVARGALPPANHPSAEDVLYQIQQCEKIVQFRDAIVAGTHPRIKVPHHPSGKPSRSNLASPSHPIGAPRAPKQAVQRQNNSGSAISAHTPNAYVPGLGAPAAPQASASSARAYGSAGAQIDPIFLEKSDDLIRAEIQLQRQRLERALREEVDQRRIAQKASTQLETLADFNLHDVLSKALTLVEATAPLNADATGLAANPEAASDSFDENSYYSSQHNSPDPSQASSQAGRASDGVPTLQPDQRYYPTVPGAAPVLAQYKPQQQTEAHPPVSRPVATYQQQGQSSMGAPQPTSPSYSYPTNNNNFSASTSTQIRRDRHGLLDGNTTADSTSFGDGSGEVSRSGSGNMMELDEQSGRSVRNAGQYRPAEPHAPRQPSPVVVAQAISPVAPQPFHVSSLATAGRAQPGSQGSGIIQGTTAQVAALRNVANTVSSPDSSPQGGRKGAKGKGKKKDKKNKKAGAHAAGVPYIKEEPRSPSPLSVPAFTRPQKRQKRQAEEAQDLHRRQPSRTFRDDGALPHVPAPAYPGPDDYRPRPASYAPAAGGYGYAPPVYEQDRRVTSSVQPYPVQYGASEYYPAAAQPVAVDRYDREPQRVYRDAYEVPRMSARPEVGRARSRSPLMRERASPLMAPPAARVVIDASGRHYYEPQPPAPAVRQSVPPPPMRMDDAEVLYERPLRAESRRPMEYEENGVVYRRVSPTYAPRRVVTQPEYATDPHRAYRQREYSSRPMPPPPLEQYVQVRSGPGQERGPAEGAPREYAMRATTARPAEPVRYEMPTEYGRVQTVRPDLPAHPSYPPAGAHREMMHPPLPRAYSMRPAESGAPRREFSARPVETYYGHATRGDEGVAYIERPPGAPQDLAYSSEPHREIYR